MKIRNLLYPILTFAGIIATAVFWVQVLGLQKPMESTGLSLRQWLFLDIAWILGSGFGCWALSRDMSLWATGSLLLESNDEPAFTSSVRNLEKKLGVTHPLQIATYPSQEINAFIAGPTKKRSVLSVSKGFLALPEDKQLDLLTPEYLKMQNGTNTLLIICQGMTYGFNLYVARVLALLLGTSMMPSEGETSSTKAEIIVSAVTTTFLTFFGSLVLGHLSRSRILWGDRDSVSILGRDKTTDIVSFWKAHTKELEQNDVFTSTLKGGGRETRWKGPFTSRPSYEKRLKNLGGQTTASAPKAQAV